MSADYTLSPRARGDLGEIWRYTADRWGADQADRYLRQLTRAFSERASGSRPGRSASAVRQDYWKLSVGSHVVFYRKTAGAGIAIIGVLHRNMDVDGICSPSIPVVVRPDEALNLDGLYQTLFRPRAGGVGASWSVPSHVAAKGRLPKAR